VPKVIETPKGEDPPEADRANLGFLRSLRPSAGAGTPGRGPGVASR
jgi:hypothetical protein